VFVIGTLMFPPQARAAMDSLREWILEYFDWLFAWGANLEDRLLRLAARRISAAQCSNPDALVVPSRAMRSILEAYGVTTPTAVTPTGIELEQFSQGDGGCFKRRYGIPVGRPVLVHIGRLAFEKNVDFLLRILVRVKREIPDILLVISPARDRHAADWNPWASSRAELPEPRQ